MSIIEYLQGFEKLQDMKYKRKWKTTDSRNESNFGSKGTEDMSKK